MKRFHVGMYGGKFLPLHKGHGYCIDVAARECDTVYAILFWGEADKERIRREFSYEWLSRDERMSHLRNIAGRLVREICGGRLDAVYSSEESYSAYFSRAYPEASKNPA